MAELGFPAYFYHLPSLVERGAIEIGEGYCGFVYKVRRSSGQQYAVKWYFTSCDVDRQDELRLHFKQEAAANAIIADVEDLKGFVPTCHAAFDSQDPRNPSTPMLIFDFVEGDGLWCIESAALDGYYSHIKHELVTIVKCLHNAGVTHGDIRPENIIIRLPPKEQPPSPSTIPVTSNGAGDKACNEKDGMRVEKSDGSDKNTKKGQNLCVLLDFSHAKTREDPDFELAKSRDWGMVSTTLYVTRERLYTDRALACLKEVSDGDASTAYKARESLIHWLSHASTCDPYLRKELDNFEPNEDDDLLYAVADFKFRQGRLLPGLAICDKVKIDQVAYDRIKWTRLRAKGYWKARKDKMACGTIMEAIEEATTSNRVFYALDFIHLFEDLSFYRMTRNFSASLFLRSKLLLDLWKLQWPDAIGGVNVTSRRIQNTCSAATVTFYPPTIVSFSTSTCTVSVDASQVSLASWTDWIKDCTIGLKDLVYNKRQKWGRSTPAGLVSICKKVVQDSLAALDAGGYRPPIATVEELSATLSVELRKAKEASHARRAEKYAAVPSGQVSSSSRRECPVGVTEDGATATIAAPLAELDVNITSPKKGRASDKYDPHKEANNKTFSPNKKQK